MVTLMAVIGVTVGVAVSYIALRPEPAPSVFGGPPSVQRYDRPARPTGTEGIELPVAFEPPRPATEPPSARAALTQFLDAEVADLAGQSPERGAESFALLDPETQRDLGSVAAWRLSRAERVVPAHFTIDDERRAAGGGVELTVTASRPPSITPFRGLVAAETTEVWSVAPAGEGTKSWRVQHGRPLSVVPHLPADAVAVSAAQRWVDGATRCDRAVIGLQLTKDLLGSPELAQTACDAKGTWTASRVVPVGELADVTPFVAAYGSGVGRWGRGVEVAAGARRFIVVVGPLGSDWRVMGLLPSGGRR
jgi:hypothetical protein